MSEEKLTMAFNKKEIIETLARRYKSGQEKLYKGSIFEPYITLPAAKIKGTMMEEFFYLLLRSKNIDCEWITTNKNYDFLINGKIRLELKVGSIGAGNKVAFNQIHFGKEREVDGFLLTIIKPDDTIDFFLVPKRDFQEGKVKVQRQHTDNTDSCSRMYYAYSGMGKILADYKIEEEKLKEKVEGIL